MLCWHRLFEFRLDPFMVENVLGQLTESRGTNEDKRMHITDIIRGDSPTFSFEFFPPKTPEAAEILYQTVRDLESYMPHFISVTYGAGGSTRDLTHDLVERIQHTTKLDPIPHLTCVCHNEEEIQAILLRYAKSGIGNILALGGVHIPIIAGIMPVTSMSGFKRIAELAGGTRFPAKLLRALQRCENDPEMVKRVGVHFALEQCHDLLDNHVAGIHFYTLNRSDATRLIFDSLGIPRRRTAQAAAIFIE